MGEPQTSNRSAGVDAGFWSGRKVLITGHTGFKGAWLSLWLTTLGAEVTGFSDGVPTEPALFDLTGLREAVAHLEGDVRDAAAVDAAVAGAAPEVVVHMAAQPLVRRSFDDPRTTYETNVLGTVNVLEAVRTAGAGTVRAVVNVTSDKCYDNRDQGRPFVESDPMGGHDPYSSSKGCAELVAAAFERSFFAGDGPGLASARAGNVVGGGDWGADRLVPDVMRAAAAGAPIPIRNPDAVRPWQHVLNPLSGYLVLAQALYEDPRGIAGGWNFGPPQEEARPVRWLADRLTERWPGELTWELDPGPHPHEARFLSLDSSKARERLGWEPRWDLDRALEAIVEWYVAHAEGEDMRAVSVRQIEAFAAAAPAAGSLRLPSR